MALWQQHPSGASCDADCGRARGREVESDKSKDDKQGVWALSNIYNLFVIYLFVSRLVELSKIYLT